MEILKEIKKLKPYDTKGSLHVYEEKYKLGNDRITLYFAVGDESFSPTVLINGKEVKD